MDVAEEQERSRARESPDPDRSSGPGPIEGVFVGRARELAELRLALEEAVGGQARVVLLAGEPGIGKSRLAAELAATARRRAVDVAWGRCWEAGGAPPYWPWVQSLRALARSTDGDATGANATSGPDVAALLAGPHATAGGAAELADPEAARFRLFESVAEYLQRRAARHPLLLVLDDLQVADTPSLLLLRFVSGSMRDDRILLVATYRDTELVPGSPLSETMAELSREPVVRRIALRGLSEPEVARYVALRAGAPSPEALAQAVHSKSEGNPLFVQELVRLLADEGTLDTQGGRTPALRLPTSIREVLRRRLRPLPAESLAVVTKAAVLGREFDLDTLARFAGHTVSKLATLLDAARVTGVVIDVPGTRDRLRFSHVLLRESVVDDLPAATRSGLHRQAGETLESMHAGDLEPYLAELAHHFLEAEHDGDAQKAFAYARAAGDRALGLLAYEEASRLYLAALEAEQHLPEVDPRRRCDLLLALGDAYDRAGDEVLSEETFLRAAGLARVHGLHGQLSLAALGYGGRLTWKRAGADEHVVPLLREGLAVLDQGDSTVRARLMARLAGALRDDPSTQPREDLAAEAVAMARRLGDSSTLGYCLEGMFGAYWRPDNLERRLAIADEIIALGVQAGDLEREASGQMYRMIVHFEQGDVAAMARDRAAADRAAEALRQPTRTWWATSVRALLALFQGRFEDAEAATTEAIALGARSYRSDAAVHHVMHLFQLRREQGRLEEVERQLAEVARAFPSYPMTRAALALLLAELDRRDAASLEFEWFAQTNFANLPWDNEWLFAMSLLGEVAHLLDDRSRADMLRGRLDAFADRNALGPIEGCTGSVHRVLGLLATTTDRHDDAEREFELALARNEQMGAWPWLARTQHAYAQMLLKRRGPADLERARLLLEPARATCERLGMKALGASVTAMLDELGGRAVAASASPGSPHRGLPHEAMFGRQGDYWVIEFGRTTRLRDTKGLRYLALLLANPGREFHAIDLAAGPGTAAPATADGREAAEIGLRPEGSDGVETIDAEARLAYRARLAELREELEEAEVFHDPERAARAREEMEALEAELAGAFGLGGRGRRRGSAAERARQSVTKAIHDALRRIAVEDPTLGDHLSRSIRTGAYCVYDPDPAAAPHWTT